jgi:DnaJ-class molecular chaperone
MEPVPTVKQLQTGAYASTNYMVCPTCHGFGRAARAYPTTDGEIRYKVEPCWVCNGTKVTLKSRPELREVFLPPETLDELE